MLLPINSWAHYCLDQTCDDFFNLTTIYGSRGKLICIFFGRDWCLDIVEYKTILHRSYFTWYTFERPLHFLTAQEIGAFWLSCSTHILWKLAQWAIGRKLKAMKIRLEAQIRRETTVNSFCTSNFFVSWVSVIESMSRIGMYLSFFEVRILFNLTSSCLSAM